MTDGLERGEGPVPTARSVSVSVVVPTIGRDRLAAVVRGALDDIATTEVVIVADRDRRRVDAVLGAAELTGDPRVVVVTGAGRGAAAARDLGITEAHGDIVVLLDDDVVPAPGLVTAHREAHVGRGSELTVGPMPVAPELRAASAIAHVYANDYDAEWTGLVADPAGVVRDLWGGNISLWRDDAVRVPQVGPLGDLRNREDQEFGLRAGRAGITGALAPRAAAIHWHEGTAAALLAAATGQVVVGRELAATYTEIGPPGDPAGGLPRAARWVVDATAVPVLGAAIRWAVTTAARRLGDGVPARWRVGLLVVARAMVQRAV